MVGKYKRIKSIPENANCYLVKMYSEDMMSTVDIEKETGYNRYTVRLRLIEIGCLRSRSESIKLAHLQDKTGVKLRGKKRNLLYTEEIRKKMSEAQKKHWEGKAKGYSLKPSGYYEITIGKNKFRALHRVLMEEYLGRMLLDNEVVHHIDGNKLNNDITNLQVMCKAEHNRLHALQNLNNRERDEYGKFK